ncbi:MAG: hypothetical protein Q8K11_13830 [Phenylobacterium sp.]|uniref:hypothetical protein n=1 Tax=Phenylobacterium sp. TaxID=1871053 RepID=UPI00273197C6|nr:hypothetical protein [Phenylobacterium sp.]MDP2011248.1 hypothetical protein [Phenylobacterium sp.]
MLLFAATLAACEAPSAALYPGTASAQLFVRNDEQRRMDPAGKLSGDQLERLTAALRQQPIPAATAACFVPHHFFRMYDVSGKMIGEIAVCFCCQGVQAKPALSIPKGQDMDLGADYEALAALVRELGSTPKLNCGPNEVEGD